MHAPAGETLGEAGSASAAGHYGGFAIDRQMNATCKPVRPGGKLTSLSRGGALMITVYGIRN
jgi:hypothetical protein